LWFSKVIFIGLSPWQGAVGAVAGLLWNTAANHGWWIVETRTRNSQFQVPKKYFKSFENTSGNCYMVIRGLFSAISCVWNWEICFFLSLSSNLESSLVIFYAIKFIEFYHRISSYDHNNPSWVWKWQLKFKLQWLSSKIKFRILYFCTF